MKIAGARVEPFLRAPSPGCSVVLLFGPDQGLVRERAQKLASGVVSDLADPFSTVDLAPAGLKSDPARLADEAAAISFGGGRRLVRVRGAGDEVTAAVKNYFATGTTDSSLVVIEAGELSNRSALRRLLEGAKEGAAIACYADDNRNLRSVIIETLKDHGLTASRDALAYLSAHLGSDRVVTRSELEKLALYKGAAGEITLEDAMACVGDSAASSLDEVIYGTGGGDPEAVDRALARVFSEGTAPVAVIRTTIRHFQRLHLVRGLMARDLPLEKAMGRLKPPVIFLRAEAFRAQARAWNEGRIARALDLLLEAEGDCKTTGMPDQAVCSRALLRIAQAAPMYRRT